MIRRPRHTAPIPPALDGPDSPGHKETQKAIDYYTAPEPNGGAPKYKAYKHDTVKETLTTIFHGKCAYCESPYRPGYYWLAAEWTNLLPSCTHCNQNRRQRVHASDEVVTIGAGARERVPTTLQPPSDGQRL